MKKKFFTVDAHEDIAFHLDYFKRDFVNPEKPCMITLPWLKEADVRLVFNTIFVHPKHRPQQTKKKAHQQLDIYDDIYSTHGNDIIQIRKPEDLDKLLGGNRIGFFTLMEGADPVYSLEDLETYKSKGVMMLGPAWNNQNKYASGPETTKGLTTAGQRLLNRMNDLGIMLDLSHLNEKCFWDAIELTEFIPVASHSNARALTDHPRNLTDDQLLAISDNGGVIGVVFYNTFLQTGDHHSTLEDIFLHMDYIISLCGEDHVGIGTDMDGARIDEFPKELQNISALPRVSDYLLNKGYSEERVEKIMGGNFLRVLRNNLETAS